MKPIDLLRFVAAIFVCSGLDFVLACLSLGFKISPLTNTVMAVGYTILAAIREPRADRSRPKSSDLTPV